MPVELRQERMWGEEVAMTKIVRGLKWLFSPLTELAKAMVSPGRAPQGVSTQVVNLPHGSNGQIPSYIRPDGTVDLPAFQKPYDAGAPSAAPEPQATGDDGRADDGLRDSGATQGALTVSHQLSASDREMSNLHVVAGGRSVTGPRSKNDDFYRFDGRIFAVSDGIGGAPYGDVMSRIGCNISTRIYYTEAPNSPYDRLVRAFNAGNNVATTVSEWMDCSSCGATLLLAEFLGDRMSFAWVGDSVAYRLRDGHLDLVTEVGRKSSKSNALDAAIGYERNIEPRIHPCDVRMGDRFLLCTDGVWEAYERSLGMDKLIHMLSYSDNAPYIAGRIAEYAGDIGTDNATAVVLIVKGGKGVLRWNSCDSSSFSDTPVSLSFTRRY